MAKNKQAFQQAIADCNANGGGVVLVPDGTWSTASIHFKSNVNLHLVKGATLLFSSDTTDYLPLVFSRWEGTELFNFSSLVYAHKAENIAITGPGKLDGQVGEWSRKYKRMDWTLPESAVLRLRAMGEARVPVEERRFGSMPDDILYPSFVHFIDCKNILLEDFTINTGPYWTIHPTYSENIIVKGVQVQTYGQANGDGINPDACKNVLIEYCLPAHVDSLNILARDFKKGQMARDMTLFVDDGKAYHIYSSEENSILHIAELNNDYTDYSGKYARVFPNRYMEAPTLWKSDGQYYIIASGCTCWKPNAARSALANNIFGPWQELGNTAIGKDSVTTFHSQSTFVLPVPGEENAFIFLVDL